MPRNDTIPKHSLPPPLDDELDPANWLDPFAYAQWTALLLAGLAAMFLLVHSVTFHRLKHRMADFILCIIGLSDLCFVALEALRHHAHLAYQDADRVTLPTALVAAALARFAFFMSLYWIATLSILMRLGRIEPLHMRRNFALSLVAASVYGALVATLPTLAANSVAHALNAAAALLLQLALLATILTNLEVVRRTTRLNDNAHGRNVLRRLTGYVVCNALFSLPFALTQLCITRVVAIGIVAESLTYIVPVTNAFLFGTSLACFCDPPTDPTLPTSNSTHATDNPSHSTTLMDEKAASNDGHHANVGPLAEMVTTGPVVKIGEGSSAVVYRTQWLGITVAMKCIRLQGVTDETEELYMTHLSEMQGTFFDEAALAAQLRHPNITLFIQLGMYKGSMCLVNEYCARGSLRDCIRANPLMDWATKVRLAFEAAKGLAFMHNRDPIYLHRDLKASNILVTADWTAKIADFGISRIAPEFILTTTRRRTALRVDEELTNPSDRETARHKTSFAGTWRWNAPEIMADPTECIFNRATDVYSFGVSMWELLTNGATPFGDIAFDHQVRVLVANGERPKIPPIYVSRAPTEFVDVLRACWDQEPGRRPTAQEVMLRLGSLSYTLANAPQDGRSTRATSTSRAVFSDNYYHAMDSARSCTINL